MTANSPPHSKPAAGYSVGYGKPPKANQFPPGVSGNLNGRPKGRPSLEELLLEEIARLVKATVGDKVVYIDKERAMLRKLIDLAIMGDVAAVRLVIALRGQAQAAMGTAADPEAPLTQEELDVIKFIANKSGKSA